MEKTFSQLTPHEVESIAITTTGDGPFAEDLFYLVFTRESYFQIPNAESDRVMDWLKNFPNVDWEQAIRAAASTSARTFLLWKSDGPPRLDQAEEAALKARLIGLLTSKFERPQEELKVLAQKILSEYRREGRVYHDLRHILHCLWELDSLPNSDDIDRTVIEIAIWYHDLVYDPRSKENEEQSAQRLLSDLGRFTTKVSLQKAAAMIRASDHRQPAEDRDLRIFLDIDLSILGRSPVEYAVYLQNVRLEYAHVSQWAFCYHRKRFLKKLLRRNLFQTPWFVQRYHAAARENIERELRQFPSRFLP